MANNFSTDPSCKALWLFKPGALTADSINGNTLSWIGGTPTSDTTNYEDALGAGIIFSAAPLYASIADANLCSGFPLKSGDTTQQATFRFWVYFPSLPGAYSWLFWKCTGGGPSGIVLQTGSSGSALQFLWGYGSGNSSETVNLNGSIIAGHSYVFTIIIDGVNKILNIFIYDETAGTRAVTFYNASNALQVNSSPFQFGPVASTWCQVIAFNRLLNLQEITNINGQTYTGAYAPASPGNVFTGNANIQAVWDFEAGAALTTDSSPASGGAGANGLSTGGTAPTADPFGVEQGAVAAYINGGYFQIADSALSAHFPLKSTCTDNKVAICGWVIPQSLPGGGGGNCAWIWSKSFMSGGGNGYQLGLFINNLGHLIFSDGTIYNANQGGVNYDTGFILSPCGIYHIACVIDIANKLLTVRFYNQATGTASDYSTSVGAINISTSSGGSFRIGTDSGYNISPYTGWLDEMVVANALLSDATIDAIREQTYRYTQTWQLTTAISVASAVSSPTLGFLWKLITAIGVASAVSSPALGVTRPLGTAIQITSATSNTVTLVCGLVLTTAIQITSATSNTVTLVCGLVLTTAIQVYSATGGPILAVIRRLSSALAVGTSTSTPLIAVTRPFSTAIAASSTTSTPNLTVSKPLSTTISVTSAVSSPVLDVIRPQTTAIQVQSQTSIPILNVIKSLVTAIGVATSTSTPLLAVIRNLATAIQVTSSTSAPWIATGYIYLKTNIQVVSQTSTVDLGVILVPPTVIYVDFRDQRVAVAL